MAAIFQFSGISDTEPKDQRTTATRALYLAVLPKLDKIK
jgi:hypothetical protein